MDTLAARQNRTTPYAKIYDHPICSVEKRCDFINVALDFGLNEKMTDDEMKDMAKQAQTCYSIQRRLEIATQLYFFDFADYHELYKTYLPGIDNWNISKNEKMNDNLKNAIYLTAEAEEVLDTVDKGTMYIIGGIVDRNRLPGLCAERAKELNLPQRRLPIKENIKFTSRCVLTVPHVYQLLLKRGTGSSWKEALKSTLSKKKIVDSDNDE